MAKYRLSQFADEDFENIFEFGIDTFGLEQAIKYQDGLKQRFKELAAQPMLYPAVTHIKEGCRRSVCGAHSIYFQIETKGILILRILGRQNVDKAL